MRKVLLIICCLFLTACLPLKTTQKAPQEQHPVLQVRHFLLKPDTSGDAEMVLKAFVPDAEIFSVSKFPAHVACAVVDGDFLPNIEESALISAFSGRGHLKNGMVLPMELVKWEKSVKRDGTAPKKDEKGTGISLRFEANKSDDDITLVTSIWYSAINGCAWASETGGLLAADAGLPKVLANLPTEMHMGQTTLFAVVSKDDEFTSLLAVSLVLGDSKALPNEKLVSSQGEKPLE